uniref:3-ketoacyl-CoA synthase n=1 Tax=Tetraselmis sp. GSL018 TaxID=582737 RepID=A0A061RWB3_9CHLO|mmetsp:Transcript_21748/g.51971  ORF Transcript_21748/g.51971 Transcript_21748/m.51971 type:complete len:505 (-) Transcript_21748:236-1750(-)
MASTERNNQPQRANGVSTAFPDYRHTVALKYVKQGYSMVVDNLLTLLLIPLASVFGMELYVMLVTGELKRVWLSAAATNVQFNLVTLVASVTLLVTLGVAYIITRRKPVYLLDFVCYKAPDRLKSSHEWFNQHSAKVPTFSEQSLEFQSKIMDRSGIGNEAYLPDGVRQYPADKSMASARAEAEMVMFGAMDMLFAQTGIKPRDVDILIVNCSLFNPTPSLSAMLVNHYKMRSDCLTYNLAGMGCSAGVIAIQLAKELLQVYPRSRCVVLSTENITQNWYFGNDRSMLIPNCLFRIGGAAIYLTNRRRDRWRAKYELLHTVRTHKGANDQAFHCVYQMEDELGNVGIKLAKELMAVAGEALKANITQLGPLVLPVSEQILFFFNLVVRKVFRNKKLRPYIPDFGRAFEHFCIHTGGKGVIDEIERQLKLGPELTKPSKDTLQRFGNTSSSSIWYILANIETFRGVRRGDRVWQIAFGSGFKCNSAVWRALRTFREGRHPAWAEE